VSHSLAYYSGLEPMYGGDIALAARMLKHMAERTHYEIQRTPSLKEREVMVTELIQVRHQRKRKHISYPFKFHIKELPAFDCAGVT
jgi:hypothetical protein